MEMKIIDPVDYPEWDDMVLAMNHNSFFHSSAWAEVLSKSFRYRPHYFILTDKGSLKGLLPIMEVRSAPTGKRGVSLTFTDYCEPIVEDQEVFHALLNEAIGFGKKSGWKYVELRGGQKYLSEAPTSARYLSHKLVLTHNEQELLARFRGNTRWSIRKAVSEGVKIKIDTTMQSVTEFYRLHCLTRKRHGVPPQPFNFFRNIHDCILANNLGHVFLASFNGANVAGAVCFHFGDEAIYKYSASDVGCRHLRANNLVLWEAIRHYALNDYKLFCLGRTDPENKGLEIFKNGWGADENSISYFTYDLRQGKFIDKNKKIDNRATRVMQALPVGILKLFGQVLYRHMG